MPVVSGGQSLWIYALLFTSLQLWGRLSASTVSPNPPAPELHIRLKSKDSAVLLCRAPEGHFGILFMLYQNREKVDSEMPQSATDEAQFTVRFKEGELYCCLYKNQAGRYSAFSHYLRLELPGDSTPTGPIPSLTAPVLSVTPSDGVVSRGGVLYFNCSIPAPLSQATHNNNNNNNNNNNGAVTFLLLRTAEPTGATSIIIQPQASHVSNTEPEPGLFTVGPVTGGEGGGYTCLYQVKGPTGLVNSTVSNMVGITIKSVLPAPTLVLQQRTEAWHLLCAGPPAYPGAVFSLYLLGEELPVSTLHAPLIKHQASFPVPVRGSSSSSSSSSSARYQCQYSALLGNTWSNSELSATLTLTRGIGPPSSPDSPGVDWPLVLGSVSAAVLFLCSVALVVVAAHRKVKAAAEEKKKREDAQFWTQVHSKDHVVDLTLRRASFNSQEWASMDSSTETASRSPLWNSHSTFTTPIHPVY